jgi:hypothetical protein
MRRQIITRVDNGNSNPAIMDYFGGSDVGVQVDVVSGTPNWTVQQTLDDVNDASVTPTWYSHPDTSNMVAQTVGRQSNYGFCPAAIRVVINSGNGTVRMTLLQHGAPGDR